MGLDAEIAAAVAKEAEAEAAKEAGPNPTPEQVKESWKRVAARAAWKFTKETGFPAFKTGMKATYAFAKAKGKRPEKPEEKKVKDLRAQDVTALGTVVEVQRSVTERGAFQVSFIAEGNGTKVTTLEGNKKMVVLKRGKIRGD
jgi:hypothetical protein